MAARLRAGAFFAAALRAGAFLAARLRAGAFFAAAFFAGAFLAARLRAGAFLAARLAGAFLAALRAVVFFATATVPPVGRSLPPGRAYKEHSGRSSGDFATSPLFLASVCRVTHFRSARANPIAQNRIRGPSAVSQTSHPLHSVADVRHLSSRRTATSREIPRTPDRQRRRRAVRRSPAMRAGW